MTLIGTVREPPRRADVEAFLARFVAALDTRLPWFEAEAANRGGPVPDGSTTSLDPLLDFVVAHIGEERPVEPPEWFGDAHRRRGWTAYGAALAEGLMAYLAAIYRARTGASWVLDTHRRSAHYHQPVMSVRFLPPPWRQVQGSVVRAQDDPNRNGSLTAVAETSLADAGVSPSGSTEDARLDVSVDRICHPKWNFEAWIGEQAEDVLGTDRFLDLVHRFQSLPGVEDAVQEDREVFLLRTARRTDTTELQRRLQAVLDEAVAEARGDTRRDDGGER